MPCDNAPQLLLPFGNVVAKRGAVARRPCRQEVTRQRARVALRSCSSGRRRMGGKVAMMILTASRADAQPLFDLECFTLSMAENEDGTGWALLISCGLEAETDSLGRYEITTHEGVTYYGGISRWDRRGVRVKFSLTAEAAGALGLERSFEIAFADSDTAGVVDAALSRITGALYI